jgi:hypothetical protein
MMFANPSVSGMLNKMLCSEECPWIPRHLKTSLRKYTSEYGCRFIQSRLTKLGPVVALLGKPSVAFADRGLEGDVNAGPVQDVHSNPWR